MTDYNSDEIYIIASSPNTSEDIKINSDAADYQYDFHIEYKNYTDAYIWVLKNPLVSNRENRINYIEERYWDVLDWNRCSKEYIEYYIVPYKNNRLSVNIQENIILYSILEYIEDYTDILCTTILYGLSYLRETIEKKLSETEYITVFKRENRQLTMTETKEKRQYVCDYAKLLEASAQVNNTSLIDRYTSIARSRKVSMKSLYKYLVAGFIKGGHIEEVKKYKDEVTMTPYIKTEFVNAALYNSHPEILEVLEEASDDNLLCLAIIEGNTEIIAKYYTEREYTFSSIIKGYIHNGNLAKVKKLLDYMKEEYNSEMKGLISQKSDTKTATAKFKKSGDVLLFEAASNGYIYIVEPIISIFKITNYSAGIMAACRNSHLDIVKFLASNSEKPVDWNLCLSSALSETVNSLDLIKYIYQQGADMIPHLRNVVMESNLKNDSVARMIYRYQLYNPMDFALYTKHIVQAYKK